MRKLTDQEREAAIRNTMTTLGLPRREAEFAVAMMAGEIGTGGDVVTVPDEYADLVLDDEKQKR